MPLPFKTVLDIEALSDAQLIALYRVIDESGLHAVKGIAFNDVDTALHARVVKNPSFTADVRSIETAYKEVEHYLFPKVIPLEDLLTGSAL